MLPTPAWKVVDGIAFDKFMFEMMLHDIAGFGHQSLMQIGFEF